MSNKEQPLLHPIVYSNPDKDLWNSLITRVHEVISTSFNYNNFKEVWEEINEKQREALANLSSHHTYKKALKQKDNLKAEELKFKLTLFALEKMIEELDIACSEKELSNLAAIRLISNKPPQKEFFKYFFHGILFGAYGYTRGAAIGTLLVICGVTYVIALPLVLLSGAIFSVTGIGFELRQILEKNGRRLANAPPFIRVANGQYDSVRFMAKLLSRKAIESAPRPPDSFDPPSDPSVLIMQYKKLIEKVFEPDLYSRDPYSKYVILKETKERGDALASNPFYRIYSGTTLLLFGIFTAYIFLSAGLFVLKYSTIVVLFSLAIANPSAPVIASLVFIVGLAILGFYVGIKVMQLKNKSNETFIAECLGISDGQSEAQLEKSRKGIGRHLKTLGLLISSKEKNEPKIANGHVCIA